jgi:hypothetical protein
MPAAYCLVLLNKLWRSCATTEDVAAIDDICGAVVAAINSVQL